MQQQPTTIADNVVRQQRENDRKRIAVQHQLLHRSRKTSDVVRSRRRLDRVPERLDLHRRHHHAYLLERSLGDGLVAIDHVRVLEEMNARTQIALRLVIYELEGLRVTRTHIQHFVVDLHGLLLADVSKTTDDMLRRKAAELKARATRRQSGDDSSRDSRARIPLGYVVADEAETSHLRVHLHHATQSALGVHGQRVGFIHNDNLVGRGGIAATRYERYSRRRDRFPNGLLCEENHLLTNHLRLNRYCAPYIDATLIRCVQLQNTVVHVGSQRHSLLPKCYPNSS